MAGGGIKQRIKWGIGHRGKIANFETGNPPEGWESEGQLRIVNLKARCWMLDTR